MYSFNPENNLFETKAGFTYDLYNEHISIDTAKSYVELYEKYAPKIKDVVHIDKLKELFEDLPHIDTYGYLVYDDFYTPKAIGAIETAARSTDNEDDDIYPDSDDLNNLHEMFTMLSHTTSASPTAIESDDQFLAGFVYEADAHIDTNDGTTFLSNFGVSDKGYTYQLWPYRFDDRAQHLSEPPGKRSFGSFIRLNPGPHDHQLLDKVEQVTIKSGQLVVLAGSALRTEIATDYDVTTNTHMSITSKATTLVHGVTSSHSEITRKPRILHMAYAREQRASLA